MLAGFKKLFIGISLLGSVLFGLILATLLVLAVIANTPDGRERLAGYVTELSKGNVRVSGLNGRFPDALSIARLEVHDAEGMWLVLHELELNWRPSQLLKKVAAIDAVHIAQLDLERLPKSQEASDQENPALPLAIELSDLQIKQLNLATPILGVAAQLQIEGALQMTSLEQGSVNVSLHRLDSQADYRLTGALAELLTLNLQVDEAPGGLISQMLTLPDLGALMVSAELHGPKSAVDAAISIRAGLFDGQLHGPINLVQQQLDLTLNAKAPAMQPAPDVAWQTLALNAKVQGPFATPGINGELSLTGLKAKGAQVQSLKVESRADQQAMQMHAEIQGLLVPGVPPKLLEKAPVRLEAGLRFTDPNQQVNIRLQHPLLSADGSVQLAGAQLLDVVMNIPELKPWSGLAGIDAQGKANITLKAALASPVKVDLNTQLALTKADPAVMKLLGKAPQFKASLNLLEQGVQLSALNISGQELHVDAKGSYFAEQLKFDWQTSLTDLSALSANLTGNMNAQGQLFGSMEHPALTADFKGQLATHDLQTGQLNAKLALQDINTLPTGQIAVQGQFANAPVNLTIKGQLLADAGAEFLIEHADWKSAQVKGKMTLPKGASWPTGTLALNIGQLADLQSFSGLPWSGALKADLQTTPQITRLQLVTGPISLNETTRFEQANLNLQMIDSIANPSLKGQMTVDGIQANALKGRTQLNFNGPLTALQLKLLGVVDQQNGQQTQLNAAAQLNLPEQNLTVSNLVLDLQGKQLTLLEPTQLDFANGLNVQASRFGFEQAVFALNGTISPALALTVSLRDLPLSILNSVLPNYQTEGLLQAEATLSGNPQAPLGTVEFKVDKLKFQQGKQPLSPSMTLQGQAELNGTAATMTVDLTDGATDKLHLSGQLPYNQTEPMDLHLQGNLDLALTDMFLRADGRRARGKIALAADITGNLTAPHPKLSLQLTQGEFFDYTQGIRIRELTGELNSVGDTGEAFHFDARSGKGTLAIKGHSQLLTKNVPLDVSVTARNARLLSSDLLTVNLNSDIALKGFVQDVLEVSGRVDINHAEIRIPEQLPPTIAELEVREYGSSPEPAKPKAASNMRLNLIIDALDEIYVRGRGMDAELGGRIHLKGDITKPQSSGAFEMRRGQFSLAGKTLHFDKGRIGFDDGGLTDPELDFVASSKGDNVSAYININGSARNPKITLSSAPELPQDEVLTYLLFKRSSSSLSAMEMVQISSALVTLTGLVPNRDPLATVRKTLKLDKLAVDNVGGPSLAAGRYIAPGVYLGVKQGLTGSQTQANVQIDITKGFKIEGAVGTSATTNTGANSGGSGGGVLYEIEY